MTYDAFQRRRRIKLMVAVVAIGVIVSAMVAIVLVYMGQVHPHSAWCPPRWRLTELAAGAR